MRDEIGAAPLGLFRIRTFTASVVAMFLAAMGFFAAIAFLPLGRAFWLSLWEINLRFANTPREFVGLGNYWDILQDARFLLTCRVGQHRFHLLVIEVTGFFRFRGP